MESIYGISMLTRDKIRKWFRQRLPGQDLHVISMGMHGRNFVLRALQYLRHRIFESSYLWELLYCFLSISQSY